MRIIIADDHPLYREAVRLLVERSFPSARTWEAGSLDELLALRDVIEGKPDIILLDLHMPGMADASLVSRVGEAFAGASVVLVSGLASAADVTSAVQSGARGFLPKTLRPELFAEALSLIGNGGSYLPTDVLHPSSAMAVNVMAPDRQILDRLTPREQQVLVRLATGAPNKEIGRDLGLAEITVKLHVRRILKKIGARNRSEAASIAAKAGLI